MTVPREPVNRLPFDQGVRFTSRMLADNESVLDRIEAWLGYTPGKFNHDGTLSVTQTRLIFSGRKRFGRRNAIIYLADIQDCELDQRELMLIPLKITFSRGSLDFYIHHVHRAWAEEFVAVVKKLQEEIQSKSVSDGSTSSIPKSPGAFDCPEQELVWKKRKKYALLGSLAVGALILANSAIDSYRSAGRERQIKEAQQESRALSEMFCDEMKTASESQTERSVSRGEELDLAFQKHSDQVRELVYSKYEDVSYELSVNELTREARNCYEEAYSKSTPPTTEAPRVKSDAELAAEGKSCAQQWRRAQSETLSGGSSDVQLRGTLYACKSLEEWVSGAFEVGEYSDGLLEVACLFEPDAPYELCG